MVTETIGDPEALGEIGFTKVIKPELVVPIVVFLASRACELTHQNYSACGGRFARVFAHLSEVTATDPYTIPGSIFEEVFAICERLGVSAMQ